MSKKAEALAVKRSDEKPDAAERAAVKTKLRAMGLKATEAAAIIDNAADDRKEIIRKLKTYIRGLKKA